jgi:hypothetical protein
MLKPVKISSFKWSRTFRPSGFFENVENFSTVEMPLLKLSGLKVSIKIMLRQIEIPMPIFDAIFFAGFQS